MLSAVLGALALALVVGGGWLALRESVPSSDSEPSSAATGGSAGSTSFAQAAVTTPPPETRAPRKSGDPKRITIPALAVDARVVPVLAPDGTLVPPSDPGVLGWWADGSRPGARRGSALVAGHTVNAGGGALDNLESLSVGDAISVRSKGGELGYAVQRVEVFDKGKVARTSERLFDQDRPGRLILLTCEDWDGARYRSNVVVFAVPID